MEVKVILLVISYFAQAYSLQCFQCIGTQSFEDCVNFTNESVVFSLDCEKVTYDYGFPNGFLTSRSSLQHSYQSTKSQRNINSPDYFCFSVGDKNGAVRSCVYSGKQELDKFCELMSEEYSSSSFHCNYCQGDHCNKSSGVYPSAVLLVIALINLIKCIYN